MFSKGLNGDQPLSIREPMTPLVFPSVVRSLKEFKRFADEHMTSLVGVNIVELIEEMEGRGRVLAGVGIGGYTVMLWIQRSVTK